MINIYHACRRPLWASACQGGRYDGSRQDLDDGFIHFSSAAKIAESLRLYCRGIADLVLIEVTAEALGPDLIWERSRDGDAFPHLYGPLDPDVVERSWDLTLDAAGAPILPDLTPGAEGATGKEGGA